MSFFSFGAPYIELNESIIFNLSKTISISSLGVPVTITNFWSNGFVLIYSSTPGTHGLFTTLSTTNSLYLSHNSCDSFKLIFFPIFLEILEDNDDVQHVYANLEIKTKFGEKVSTW